MNSLNLQPNPSLNQNQNKPATAQIHKKIPISKINLNPKNFKYSKTEKNPKQSENPNQASHPKVSEKNPKRRTKVVEERTKNREDFGRYRMTKKHRRSKEKVKVSSEVDVENQLDKGIKIFKGNLDKSKRKERTSIERNSRK